MIVVERRRQARGGLPAFIAVLMIANGAMGFAQVAPVSIELRRDAPGPAGNPTVVEAIAGGSVTLVFRIANPAAIARSVVNRVDLPTGWQVLFVSERLDLPAQGSVIETVTIAAPSNAAAGDYPVRYEARLTPSDTPVATSVTLRVAERRQVAVSWPPTATYLRSGEPATFELLVTNNGNVKETVTLSVKSALGLPLQASWTRGGIDAGETCRIQVVRPPDRTRLGLRETLVATATAEGLPATATANLGFDVVPEGRAPDARRSMLPTTLALRTGTGRSPGFGSFMGAGALNAHQTTTVNFGFVARDRSHPLMFERDRNYVNIMSAGASLSAGDQIWALSYLTENGHYGLGAGGRIERRHWSAGAFVDTGRHDVTEGSQAGGFFGLSTGRVASVSAQYLARFSSGLRSTRLADIGSVRVLLRPLEKLTGDFEAGIGQSSAGTGRAISALVSFSSRLLTLYGRRVRKDDIYPLRDRTGLIDGAGVAVRPFGRFQIEGTLDGTGQLDDPTLPLDAPTRQRITRARLSWGSLVRVTAGRTEWTSPGRDWSAQWRRESVRAELHIPLGPIWFSPGVERGTEAAPSYINTPYSLGWLRAGVRLARRNSIDVRMDYGRGDRGDADRIVRRVSFGAALQPIDATRLTVRMNSSANDALWLQGTQSITALLDQRLPWRHHIVVHYERRSGGGTFSPDAEAYRVDYVIPVGIPIRSASDSGGIVVRLRDGDNGKALERMLVQIKGQARLTDRDGVVAFTGLKPGDYHVTVSPDSLGPGRTVMPSLPLKVSVKGGSKVEINAAVVRTGTVSGALHILQTTVVPAAPAGLANAIIQLVINDEHRTAVTDVQGRFTFEDVPPGTWRVRVVRADIPPFYRLEEAQITVTVTPAGTRHIVLRVIPKSQ